MTLPDDVEAALQRWIADERRSFGTERTREQAIAELVAEALTSMGLLTPR